MGTGILSLKGPLVPTSIVNKEKSPQRYTNMVNIHTHKQTHTQNANEHSYPGLLMDQKYLFVPMFHVSKFNQLGNLALHHPASEAFRNEWV